MPKETSAGAVIFRRNPPPSLDGLRTTEGQGNNKIYYLLLHYESGHWDFPKGHIEQGEKEEDTVKREVREETGIEDIKIINGFKEWVKYTFRQNYNLKAEEKNKAPCPHTKQGIPSSAGFVESRTFPCYGVGAWIFKIVTFYLAETKTKEVKISFEHQGFKWLPYEMAFKQLKFKNAKDILEKANNFIMEHKI